MKAKKKKCLGAYFDKKNPKNYSNSIHSQIKSKVRSISFNQSKDKDKTYIIKYCLYSKSL